MDLAKEKLKKNFELMDCEELLDQLDENDDDEGLSAIYMEILKYQER